MYGSFGLRYVLVLTLLPSSYLIPLNPAYTCMESNCSEPHVVLGSRHQFIPQMVNSLNRLGLPPNCTIENRALAVDLAELIVTWEETNMPTVESDATFGGDTSKQQNITINESSVANNKYPGVMTQISEIMRNAKRMKKTKKTKKRKSEADKQATSNTTSAASSKAKRSSLRKKVKTKELAPTRSGMAETLRCIRNAQTKRSNASKSSSKSFKKPNSKNRKRQRKMEISKVRESKSKRAKPDVSPSKGFQPSAKPCESLGTLFL